MGFNPDPIRFLIFIVIVLVLSFTAGSLGLVIASVAPSGQAAASMGPPILVVAIDPPPYPFSLAQVTCRGRQPQLPAKFNDSRSRWGKGAPLLCPPPAIRLPAPAAALRRAGPAPG